MEWQCILILLQNVITWLPYAQATYQTYILQHSMCLYASSFYSLEVLALYLRLTAIYHEETVYSLCTSVSSSIKWKHST